MESELANKCKNSVLDQKTFQIHAERMGNIINALGTLGYSLEKKLDYCFVLYTQEYSNHTEDLNIKHETVSSHPPLMLQSLCADTHPVSLLSPLAAQQTINQLTKEHITVFEEVFTYLTKMTLAPSQKGIWNLSH